MRGIVILMVLGLFAASAPPGAADAPPEDEEEGAGEALPPCVHLDVHVPAAGVGRTDRTVPDGCDEHKPVHVRWNATSFESRGHLKLGGVGIPPAPEKVGHSRLFFVAQSSGSPDVPQPASTPHGASPPHVVLRYHVSWNAADCSDARGNATLAVGPDVHDLRGTGFLRDVCAVSTAPPPASAGPDAPPAALLVAALGNALLTAVPGLPDPPEPGVLGTLEFLARTWDAAAPPPEVHSEEDDDRDAGDLLAEGWAVVEWAPGDVPEPRLEASTTTRGGGVDVHVHAGPVHDHASAAAPPGEPFRAWAAATVHATPRGPPAAAPATAPGAPAVPPRHDDTSPADPVAPAGGPTRLAIVGGPVPPAAGVGAVVVAGVGLTLLAGVAVALYQRLTRSDALDHPSRRRLHEACAALDAPATVGELASAARLTRKTAEYHLLYLARLQLVATVDGDDGRLRYALPAHVSPNADKGPLSTRLARAVRDAPGRTTADLARRAGVTRSRADRHLKGLTLDGVVESRVVDGRRCFFPCEPRHASRVL